MIAGDVDWSTALEVEIDPRLAEAIRSRARLRQITLRVGAEQIEEARRVATRTGVPYQLCFDAGLLRELASPARYARPVSFEIIGRDIKGGLVQHAVCHRRSPCEQLNV